MIKRPVSTLHGALEMHRDSCDGPRIARLLLTTAAKTSLQTTLHATLHALQGAHDLCIFATGDPMQGLWAVDKVKLSP